MAAGGSGPNYTTAAAIAAGQSLSGVIVTGTLVLHGIFLPANWTAADLTFQVSYDGGVTFSNMYAQTAPFSSSTAAVDYNAPAGTYVALDPTLWRAVNAFKIRSGTIASPVAQTNNVSLQLALQYLS